MNNKKVKALFAQAKEGKVIAIDCGGELGAKALLKEIFESRLGGFSTRVVLGSAFVYIIPAPSKMVQQSEVE